MDELSNGPVDEKTDFFSLLNLRVGIHWMKIVSDLMVGRRRYVHFLHSHRRRESLMDRLVGQLLISQECVWRIAMIVVAGLTVFLIISPATTFAHGAGEEITSVVSGPFIIGVRMLPAEPVVGIFHISVSVRDVTTESQVNGATVNVFAIKKDGGANLFSPALTATSESLYYDANLELEEAGTWIFRTDVETDSGSGSAQFELYVAERSRGGSNLALGTALFAVVVLAIVGGATWVAYSARRIRA